MRVLLFGAGGMLGSDLAATAPPEAQVTPLSRAELDITDAPALARAIRAARPDIIMNAAAYTFVDRAESERELAFRVNAEAVGAIGESAAASGAVAVHFSTDYVFDGTPQLPYPEDALPSPVNAYGASKLAGEVRLAESRAPYLLVRTQWLFGAHGRSFPRSMWERACRGMLTRVVNDQTGRPTFTVDLAWAVWRLLASGSRGVFNVANAGIATWYEVAERVFAGVGRSHLLTPCATSEHPSLARRPAYSVLDTTKAEQELRGGLPIWTDALSRFVDRLEHTDSTLS